MKNAIFPVASAARTLIQAALPVSLLTTGLGVSACRNAGLATTKMRSLRHAIRAHQPAEQEESASAELQMIASSVV